MISGYNSESPRHQQVEDQDPSIKNQYLDRAWGVMVGMMGKATRFQHLPASSSIFQRQIARLEMAFHPG